MGSGRPQYRPDPVSERPMCREPDKSENIVINEIQLLLAEKRTSLATMRTGIAVFALPLSVLSILVATSKYYDLLDVLYLIIPLFVLCGGLVVLGVYLTHRAVRKVQHYDHMIQKIKKQNSEVDKIID